jgi:hypothetical protein
VTIATGVVPNTQQQKPSASKSQIAGEKDNFGEEG